MNDDQDNMENNGTQGLARRSVVMLFIANGVSFLIIGLSYALYSKLLSPEEFGLYSIALVIGTFGVLILDGGLKNTIIKSSVDLNKEEEGTLIFLMITSSIILLFILVLLDRPLVHFFPAAKRDFHFLAIFGGLYLLSYPFMAISTAKFERRLNYDRIAWVESIGLILERGTPVFFLLWSKEGIYSFIWGLFFGRLFRVISLNIPNRINLIIPSRTQLRAILYLLTEGTWLQFSTGASLIRDNLHVLLVGPIYGKDWVGYYAWGQQLCLIASQIFVQISARVSLPFFVKTEKFEDRWRTGMYQIRLLTILTGPILVILLMAIPSIDRHFLQGKWQTAISFLPFLFIRMLPGLATTPLGTLLMVQKGGRVFARANILWMLFELISAFLLLLLVGPTGLAWSYSLMVWLGLWGFLKFMDQPIHKMISDIFQAIIKRPSLMIALISFLALQFYFHLTATMSSNLDLIVLILLTCLVLSISYISEREIRRFIGINT